MGFDRVLCIYYRDTVVKYLHNASMEGFPIQLTYPKWAIINLFYSK
jgi:hypothetical protein